LSFYLLRSFVEEKSGQNEGIRCTFVFHYTMSQYYKKNLFIVKTYILKNPKIELPDD